MSITNKKVTLKFKDRNVQKTVFPLTKVEYLLKDTDETPIDTLSENLLKVNYQSLNGKNFTLLGSTSAKKILQVNKPSELNLSDSSHDSDHTISHFAADANYNEVYTATSGREISLKGISLKDLIETYKVEKDGQGKISIDNLPDFVSGQLKYKNTVNLSMQSYKLVSSITDFSQLNTNTKLKEGWFVIVNQEGFLSFSETHQLMSSSFVNEEEVVTDAEMVEALLWDLVPGDEDIYSALDWTEGSTGGELYSSLVWIEEEVDTNKIHLSAGTMIIYIGKEDNVHKFALIKTDVKNATAKRYGVVKYKSVTAEDRSELGYNFGSDSVITSTQLKKLGFDITFNTVLGKNELVFESFE